MYTGTCNKQELKEEVVIMDWGKSRKKQSLRRDALQDRKMDKQTDNNNTKTNNKIN